MPRQITPEQLEAIYACIDTVQRKGRIGAEREVAMFAKQALGLPLGQCRLLFEGRDYKIEGTQVMIARNVGHRLKEEFPDGYQGVRGDAVIIQGFSIIVPRESGIVIATEVPRDG